ncbi:MAG: helix-turn-helix transcriptional regulator [Bacteroidia bacterium]
MSALPEYDLPDPQARMALRVEALARTGRYNPNHPHRHRYCEIFLFTAGSGTHMIDFAEWPIAPGQVHLVFPGQVHQVMRSGDSEGVVLCFGSHFIPDPETLEALDGFREQPSINAGPEAVNQILRWVTLYQSELQPAPGTDRHLLGIVLAKCLNLKAIPPSTSQQSIFTRFLTLLESQFRSQKQVSPYADQLAITADRLTEICRQHRGRAAGELIRERIILEAKRLLLHSQLSIKEIAYDLGYEDPAYFNRLFQKDLQVPPQRFRELIREKYKPNPDSSNDG